mmetsp:Transcript_127834/g.368101  ORF Transcript_127834/g.368101 Transcript_127834/m.368101 type:complete len:267 (+) Transcript_127834:106-906(+)
MREGARRRERACPALARPASAHPRTGNTREISQAVAACLRPGSRPGHLLAPDPHIAVAHLRRHILGRDAAVHQHVDHADENQKTTHAEVKDLCERSKRQPERALEEVEETAASGQGQELGIVDQCILVCAHRQPDLVLGGCYPVWLHLEQGRRQREEQLIHRHDIQHDRAEYPSDVHQLDDRIGGGGHGGDECQQTDAGGALLDLFQDLLAGVSREGERGGGVALRLGLDLRISGPLLDLIPRRGRVLREVLLASIHDLPLDLGVT